MGAIGLRVESRDVGKMKSLRIHPDFRRQGLGRRLVETLENFCRDNGYKKVILGVGADSESESAVRLYRSMDYCLTGEKIFEDGDRAYYFEKDLTVAE